MSSLSRQGELPNIRFGIYYCTNKWSTMTLTGEATPMFYYAVWVLLSLLYNVMKESIFWVSYQKGLKSRQRPNPSSSHQLSR